MKKFIVIISTVLLSFLLFGCQSGTGNKDALTSETEKNEINLAETIEDTTAVELEEVLDIENLKENEFRISDLPGKITVSDAYNVYSIDNEYTNEMCAEQDIEPDRLKLYLDLQKEYSGINMFIIPKDEPFASTDFEIQIKVKDEKDYEIDNLIDLSDYEFDMYEEVLLLGFENSMNTDLTSSVYENEKTKWVIFDCHMVDYETRYSTILNGKMIYVIGKSTNDPVSDNQKNDIIQIIDSLKF